LKHKEVSRFSQRTFDVTLSAVSSLLAKNSTPCTGRGRRKTVRETDVRNKRKEVKLKALYVVSGKC
jgi:histone H3/H4